MMMTRIGNRRAQRIGDMSHIACLLDQFGHGVRADNRAGRGASIPHHSKPPRLWQEGGCGANVSLHRPQGIWGHIGGTWNAIAVKGRRMIGKLLFKFRLNRFIRL